MSALRLVPLLRVAAVALLESQAAPAPIPTTEVLSALLNQDRRSVPSLVFCMCCQPRPLYPVRLFHRRQVNPDINRMIAAPQNNAANRADVAIIAAPRQRDVALGRHHIIGWIYIQPARARAKDRDPGVRRIGPY